MNLGNILTLLVRLDLCQQIFKFSYQGSNLSFAPVRCHAYF
jgi:hypothetical protein